MFAFVGVPSLIHLRRLSIHVHRPLDAHKPSEMFLLQQVLGLGLRLLCAWFSRTRNRAEGVLLTAQTASNGSSRFGGAVTLLSVIPGMSGSWENPRVKHRSWSRHHLFTHSVSDYTSMGSSRILTEEKSVCHFVHFRWIWNFSTLQDSFSFLSLHLINCSGWPQLSVFPPSGMY